MYVHEQIMQAVAQIQQRHDLTKEETVAEMAQAIHIMLLLNEPDIGTMLDSFLTRELALAKVAA